ncbi:MAG: hypothetical protein MUE82_13540 [Chloroflexi bacterium]|jgi:hypothetical protein|nr:hypothetical protein [Chloroflexota bacterium]
MRRSLLRVVALVAVAVALSACGDSGPLAVKNVTLSTTEGGAATTTFSPSDHVIHAAIELNRIEPGLTARTVWTAVDTEAGQGIEVASNEFSSLAANTIQAKLELPNDWPTGTYKLDVYLNGSLATSVDYSVQ